ncbi:unannotated protein [freshwater metagenome]|uniref:Unannotated protein n=1 Tax=freshwater metagenome TaxID=449393 RepID=A0A6J6UHY7_9ZZZZ
MAAPDHRVATSASWMRVRARRTASSKLMRPSGGSGIHCLISLSVQVAGWLSDRTSGRAIAFGTGVTRLTQWLDSWGESRLIGRMMRRGSPATLA